jgi:hypothetical protein
MFMSYSMFMLFRNIHDLMGTPPFLRLQAVTGPHTLGPVFGEALNELADVESRRLFFVRNFASPPQVSSAFSGTRSYPLYDATTL